MTTYTPKAFAAHLATAGQRLHPELTRTVNKAAMNVKADWRRRAAVHNPPGSASARYPSTIVQRRGKVVGGVYTAEVESLDRGQGKLGSVLEYGGGRNAPQRSNVAALDAEAPVLAAWLERIAAKVIR